MNTITIGFSRAKSPWAIFSTAIQKVENRKFSHAYVRYIDPSTGLDMISQASHGMVHECYIAHFEAANAIVEEYDIECTSEQFMEFLKFNKTNLGAKYSIIQLVGIAISKMFHVRQWFVNGDKAFICSEWAAKVAKVTGKAVPTSLDGFTPSDLNNLLKQQRT